MNEWYGADELRESWLFLVVVAAEEDETSYLKGWVVADGNAQQLLEPTEKVITESASEDGALVALGQELDLRRYQNTTLITPAEQTLKFLRARYLTTNAVSNPTFRGYTHVALNTLYEEYVDATAADVPDAVLQADPRQRDVPEQDQTRIRSAVKRLWKLWVALGPLLPAEALRGDAT